MTARPRCRAKNRVALSASNRAPRVPARVGVQRLLLRGEGVEQRETGLARHVLVVPLEQELERDGDLCRRLGQGLVPEQTEDRGGDPGFDRRQRHPDRGAQRDAPVADRPAGRSPAVPAGRPGSPAIPARRAPPGRCCIATTIGPIGSPAACACRRAAICCSSAAVRGRSPCPGASMAATLKPQPVTKRCARPRIPGALLCWPPLCAISTRGARSEPDAGDQSRPVTSPRVKLRSRTPFDDVSAVKCIGCCLSGLPCRGAPGDSYVNRPAVKKMGSTQWDTAFMGLTSSRDVTDSRRLSASP